MAMKFPRKLEVKDVKALTDAQINKLKCGDVVVKDEEGSQHAYIVTFKKNNVGICLTYTDASVVETQSYDYTDGKWVYNSADITPLTE